MDWKLKNPKEGLFDVSITSTLGDKFHLNLRYSWMSRVEAVDGYAFPSDSAAKRYFATHYQSIKRGCEKPQWEKQ